ncbi:MAG TPA: nickel pincer cofactor biosynthesis protein LarB [Pirellulaceae bacterium]|nr:nickel pincer cofactor biosynthesis protein LarB [Pirellulaceae bacterium]
MHSDHIQRLAAQLLQGQLSTNDFLQAIAPAQAALNEVTLDLDRQRRCGYPEVIYGDGKSVPTLIRIVRRLLVEHQPILATRISAEKATELLQEFPAARYNELARTFRLAGGERELPDVATQLGQVAVVTAGTSDLPVAEEARETLDWMGVAVSMIHDVGVAGPHRLPRHLEVLREADAIVVVAGLEGALPSVVGGYVDAPVIAVPTSVGYGASFGGVAALLGMLNSCASNVTVVNIDAGFKAGYVAGLIAQRIWRGR